MTLVGTSVLIGPADLHGVDEGDRWAVSAVTVGELEAGVLLAADPTVRAACGSPRPPSPTT